MIWIIYTRAAETTKVFIVLEQLLVGALSCAIKYLDFSFWSPEVCLWNLFTKSHNNLDLSGKIALHCMGVSSIASGFSKSFVYCCSKQEVVKVRSYASALEEGI